VAQDSFSDKNLYHLVTGTRRFGPVDLEDEGNMFHQNVAYQLHSVEVSCHGGTGVYKTAVRIQTFQGNKVKNFSA
jgi:hypothetical protein